MLLCISLPNFALTSNSKSMYFINYKRAVAMVTLTLPDPHRVQIHLLGRMVCGLG